jgi:hypothetical protein
MKVDYATVFSSLSISGFYRHVQSSEEARLPKEFYGCDPDKQFDVPDGARDHLEAQFAERGTTAYTETNCTPCCECTEDIPLSLVYSLYRALLNPVPS